MALKLHNTLSRKKELFQPINPDHVTMYVCGPTVYDRAHIGNARPYVVFDVLYRYLKETYPKVTYARNFTDVDDKIIKAAAERSIEIAELTSQTEDFFHGDMGAIGVGIPDIEPRATEHIDEMIAMIEKLIAKGHAYEAEGHALFDVSSMKDYGKLSGKNQDELIAGARVEVAPYKRTPCDFVLWKPAKEDEPGWDSPWGRGRPGWHIECSAMAEKHLGKQIDIHGGGQDLVFPHHENEVAQSTCAHDGLALARYWVHNGMLMVEGKKMSKSLGNFFTVSDVLALAPGEVIRYYILSTHYHQPFDWTKTSLEQARQSLNRLYTALANAPVEAAAKELSFNQLPKAFVEAIEDDLNTPLAFAVMHEWAGRLNKAEESEEILSHTYGQLLLMGKMLGIFTVAPATWLKGLDTVTDAEVMEIEALIKERIEARKTKNFARADEIRDILVSKDIILEDRSGETIWRKK